MVIEIYNRGTADLIINSLSSDCPCTSFLFLTQVGEEDARTVITIPAGEKRELRVKFDASRTKYIGSFSKMILIGSNDPTQPLKRIKMEGTLSQ